MFFDGKFGIDFSAIESSKKAGVRISNLDLHISLGGYDELTL